MSKSTARFVWKKLSPAKWEDVWQERLSWLGQRLVTILLKGMKTIRVEAYHVTREEADTLTREFGGQVRPAKELTALDLEPKPRPPLRVRGRLLVVSSEKERALAAKSDPKTPSLFIPATVAFGTGEHATTATCLRILADVAAEQTMAWDALDLGTGSGILAFAACIFGARRVEAFDFDATAVRVAKENLAANALRGVTLKRGDVLKWQPKKVWPVVMANLFSPTLIAAAKQITAAVAPGGALILSGILREQAEDVVAAFQAQHCRFERIVRKGKWVTCLARIRS